MKHISINQKRIFTITAFVLLIAMLAAPAALADAGAPTPIRFATFNASLNRFNAGDLVEDLSHPENLADPNVVQAHTIAEIIQRTRPDVLLINEFDYDAGGLAAQYFQENYLSVSQNGAEPIV